MKKQKLIPGRKYLHRKTYSINNRTIQAQRWIKCEGITESGAVFSRAFEENITLSDKEIEEELADLAGAFTAEWCRTHLENGGGHYETGINNNV